MGWAGLLMFGTALFIAWAFLPNEETGNVEGFVGLLLVLALGLSALDLIYSSIMLHRARRRDGKQQTDAPRGGYPSGPARSKPPRVPRGPAA